MDSNYKRMVEGRLYDPGDDEILSEQVSYLEDLYEFNATRPSEMEKRDALLHKMLGSCGEGCYIQPPFNANWGGKHLFFGRWIYANSNLTCVDDGNIYVGDCVMFGPNVTIATAGHPVEPKLRSVGIQYNADVHIGNNAWIGAGAIILPGVTIGDNAVIGAGSVVNKDIPANVVAVGNPCKVLREVNEQDQVTYFRGMKVDLEIPQQLRYEAE